MGHGNKPFLPGIDTVPFIYNKGQADEGEIMVRCQRGGIVSKIFIFLLFVFFFVL